MTTIEDIDDPYLRHFHREPLPDAGIRIILLTELPVERAEAIVATLAEPLEAMGRTVESRIVPVAGLDFGAALSQGLEGARLPLVLVTTAEEPWREAHLEPLLKAIDHCDHVVGCRPADPRERWKRWLAAIPRRLVFAVPLRDVHSPCRLHRLEKLATIPLQSGSSFLDIEILAKATFYGHLIDEVEVPPLQGLLRTRGRWTDCRHLLRDPRFELASGPAEEPESQGECEDGPGGEDRQGRSDIEQPGPLEQDAPRAH